MTDNVFIILILVAMLALGILLPKIAITARDAEMEKKKKEAEKRHFSLDEFKKELIALYKEEYAIADGNSYSSDPATMNRVEAMFDNGILIRALKEEYPEYEGQYDNDELYKKARYEYGRDILNLMDE